MTTIAPLHDAQLPSISLAHLASLKGFFRRRGPLAFSLGEMPLTMEAASPDEAPQDRVTVAVTVDNELHLLALSKAFVDAVLASLDPALDADALTPQALALLLEYAAAPAIRALEARAGVSIRFATAAAGTPSATPDRLNLPFLVKGSPGDPSIALLNLTVACAERLVPLLDGATPKPPRSRDLPLAVSLRQVAVQLSLAEVKSLAVGDVIVGESRAAQPAQGVILVGGMLAAPVELKPEGAVLLEPLRPARNSPHQWCMDMPSSSSDASLDEMPVQIVIELGRLDLPLAEVEALAAGSVLPLGRRLEEGVEILANGRRIGRGTLVTIGDSLGVRVARLG
jgi:type III secretion protein Q